MKPTKEELIRKIDALGVSDTYKPGIRDLVAEITGIDLTPEPTYSVGQRFHYNGITFRGDYILAALEGDNKVGAVNLATGTVRKTADGYPIQRGVAVKSRIRITKAELAKIFRVPVFSPEDRVIQIK